MDALGVAWQYEPQGFDLPSGMYLPDFHLPQHDAWLEIKGKAATPRERKLLEELGAALECKNIYLAEGDIPRSGFIFGSTLPHASVQHALSSARSARFEHGHSGVS
jgi:hypothetical protein